MLSVIMPSVIMVSTIMLNVVMLSVVAPFRTKTYDENGENTEKIPTNVLDTLMTVLLDPELL